MTRISKKVTITKKQSDALTQEVHLDVKEAILREKQIKKWNRQWKINLIEQHNPQWLDFSIGLY